MLLGKHENMQSVFAKEFYMLGTIIRLKVHGYKGEKALGEAITKLTEIDDKMSVFKADSEISKINYNSGNIPQKVSHDTYYVIKKAVKYSELSNGAFDPTIRPVVDLWGICTDYPRIPKKKEINSKLELVNYKDIVLNEENSTIKLNKENQAIDLGGIAKGYAADEVKNIFLRNQIKSAIIDLGGNIFAIGNKADGVPWSIGIQDPARRRGECIGSLSIVNKSIVTSGNYERYFIIGGRRFHHIIDPRTGYPSENGVISTTIISDCSIDGDALATCAYVMGLSKGIDFIESLEGVDAIFITEDKGIYTTSGIKDNFKLLNKEFIYKNYVD